MSELPLERLLPEQDFVEPLSLRVLGMDQVSHSLLADPSEGESWRRRHFFRVYSEAEALEGFLDDYGARYNRTYHFLTELVASLRGLSHAGFGMQHVLSRFESYGVSEIFGAEDRIALRLDLDRGRTFLRRSVFFLLGALRTELGRLGVELGGEGLPRDGYDRPGERVRLPRNMGQEEPVGEEQRIAEVATKYLQACGMLEEIGIRRIEDPELREDFLNSRCTEERCRVYEATVHNLQSAYDTFIKNTVIEARDARLPQLRGHVSVALHLLEVATHLTHFVERHESSERNVEAARRMAEVVDRGEVRDVTLNILLFWADRVLRSAQSVAEELLPNYINLRELEVELEDGIVLHARPASLIVGIVNHHGTPVEMEVEGSSCNAGSILELMVTVGTNPEARQYRFRGDAGPLGDIQMLFEHGVGERGLEHLPEELDYLRR